MLFRYYDTVRSPVSSLDLLKIFCDVEGSSFGHRFDTIDEEGIKIELPGVKSEAVDGSVDGRTIKVTGKSRHGKEISYSYSLKSGVDEVGITAKLENGLLSISLPKKQESSIRKIPVI